MDINNFISGVTQNISNKTAPRSIAPSIVGQSFIDLATLTKQGIKDGIEQVKSFYKGLAFANTVPDYYAGNQYYDAIAGVSYLYFRDSNNQPISIPSTVDGKTVGNAKLTLNGAYWVATWTVFDITGVVSSAAPTVHDYTISIENGVIYARPRFNSGLPAFSNTDAYQVIQGAIDTLSIGNKGSIFITSGTYYLSNELLIQGKAIAQPPSDQLVIEGSGFSTILFQDTPDKNGIVVKNRASIVFRNFYIYTGTDSRCCLLLDDSGTGSEVSVFGGIIDGVFCAGNSLTHPAAYIKNTFDMHFPSFYSYNPNNDGLIIESTSPDTIYGNSHFGFLRTYAKDTHAGLVLRGLTPYKSLDMVSFSNYECISALYGIYLDGASACSFEFVDIEYIKYPIYFGGDATRESLGNKFLGGYIYPQGTGARGITVSEFAGGNTFNLFVQTDDDTTEVLQDDKLYRAANEYNLSLSFFTDGTKYTLAEPNNTILNIKTAINGVTQHIPNAPLTDVSNSPATTFWVYYQGFVKQADADLKYPTVQGYNAIGKWGIDIYGNADYWGGLRADVINTINTAPLQVMAIDTDYVFKPFTQVGFSEWLGLKQSGLYEYQPAPLDEPFFNDAKGNTQDVGDNTSNLATTAFVQAEFINFVNTKYSAYEATTGTVGSFNTVFNVSGSIVGSSETVFLDGKAIAKTSYTVFGTAIVFTTAPAFRPYVTYFMV